MNRPKNFSLIGVVTARAKREKLAQQLTLISAVAQLVVNSDLWKTHELWRAAWSSEDTVGVVMLRHKALRVERDTNRLLAVDDSGYIWTDPTLTTGDILAQDWEVQPCAK